MVKIIALPHVLMKFQVFLPLMRGEESLRKKEKMETMNNSDQKKRMGLFLKLLLPIIATVVILLLVTTFFQVDILKKTTGNILELIQSSASRIQMNQEKATKSNLEMISSSSKKVSKLQQESTDELLTAILNQAAKSQETQEETIEELVDDQISAYQRSIIYSSNALIKMIAGVAPNLLKNQDYSSLQQLLDQATTYSRVAHCSVSSGGKIIVSSLTKSKDVLAFVGDPKGKSPTEITKKLKPPNFFTIEQKILRGDKKIGVVTFVVSRINIIASVEELEENAATMNDDLAKMFSSLQSVVKVKSTSNMKASEMLFNSLQEEAKTHSVSAQKATGTLISSIIKTADNQVNRDTKKAVRSGGFISFVGILLVVGILYFVIKTTTMAIIVCINAAKKISNGDLIEPINITRNDEIGLLAEAMNSMREATSKIVGRVNISAVDISQATSNQCASLEETSASLHEISSMSKNNTETIHQMKDLMNDTKKVVAKATGMMNDLSASMIQIQGASRKTKAIIETIDGIAFQTNLLALNAAVEAARAGEQGAGFAVVAEEVRGLAQRVAEASKKTTELVAQTVSSVDAGVVMVEDTNKVVSEVDQISSQLVVLAEQTDNASTHQSGEVERINQIVATIESASQDNNVTADQLITAMQYFRLQSSDETMQKETDYEVSSDLQLPYQ